jgi:hypothetical protein
MHRDAADTRYGLRPASSLISPLAPTRAFQKRRDWRKRVLEHNHWQGEEHSLFPTLSWDAIEALSILIPTLLLHEIVLSKVTVLSRSHLSSKESHRKEQSQDPIPIYHHKNVI